MPKERFYLPFHFTHHIYSRSRPGIERVWDGASGFIHYDCKYRYCCQFYRALRDYAWKFYDRPTESWADSMAEKCHRIAEKKKEDSIQKMYRDYCREHYNPLSGHSSSTMFNDLFWRHAGELYESDRNEVYYQPGNKGYVFNVKNKL